MLGAMEPTTIARAGAKVASAAITPRQTADPALMAVLKRLREKRGLSQEALAHEAGLTTSAYNRIESGTAAPGWSTVRRLAKALGVSMADLGRLVESER
jgi:DNA-binding XRE family transcriptional regulator